MANVKISNLTAATTPVAGTEVLPIVQSGATVKVSIANLTAGRAVSVLSLTSTNDSTISGLTVGKGAGAVSTNTAVGASALASGSQTGTKNTAIGQNTLAVNTSGSNNIAVGTDVLPANTTGGSNVSAGVGAMYANTTGSSNSAFGDGALQANTTASNNTAVGYQAGYTNSTGENNVFLGGVAGYTSTGSSNLHVGYGAGYSSTGSNNTFVGAFGTGSTACGGSMTTGSKNTILGSYSGNQGGLDIRTASNYIVLSDGDGNPRGIFNNSGDLLVGKTALNLAVGTSIDANTSAGSGVRVVSSASTASADGFQMYSTGTSTYRFAVGFNGTISAVSTVISSISDARLKENVRDLNVGLSEIMALKPRLYDWKEGKGANIKNARGFIAQEFETVFPDLIDESRDPAPEGEGPYKAVRADLIPVLVKAIQELKAEVDSLKAQINGASA